MKQIYGIIGHPVSHSLSPAMQKAAFESLGIEAEYDIFDVKPDGLEDFLSAMTKKKIAGLNVTIPHKIAARDYIDKNGILDANAKRLGAVNTINVTDGRLNGYNTDGPGFYRSLVEDLEFEPEGKSVFVLGAGGAATAIIMYLGNSVEAVLVYDIDEKKLEALKKQYHAYYDTKRLVIIKKEDIKGALDSSALLINATPVGMNESDPSPLDVSLLHGGMRVYDLIYNREATTLVREARRRKLHAVTGLGMLLYQGAIAFEIWTGMKAPVGVMRKALKEALKNSVKC